MTAPFMTPSEFQDFHTEVKNCQACQSFQQNNPDALCPDHTEYRQLLDDTLEDDMRFDAAQEAKEDHDQEEIC